MNNEKHPVLTFLGLVAMAAVLAILWKFIASGYVLQHWSTQWAASLFFVILLLIVGLGFLYLGGDAISASIPTIFFGVAYFLTSLILYLFLGYAQITRVVPFSEFTGLTALFLLSLSVGLIFFHAVCVHATNHQHLIKWPSYGYAAAMLLLILGMVAKYVFKGEPAHKDVIIEAIILATGAAIFMHLHTKSKSD